jgi:hypothetical protein
MTLVENSPVLPIREALAQYKGKVVALQYIDDLDTCQILAWSTDPFDQAIYDHVWGLEAKWDKACGENPYRVTRWESLPGNGVRIRRIIDVE